MSKQYDMDRFVKAQKNSYDTALSEIRDGMKRSHWMWYIFPQIIGLGRSEIAVFYSMWMRKRLERIFRMSYCEAICWR